MMAPRRLMMSGVARFMQEHEPWSIYLKPTFAERSLRRWLEQWNGDGIITTIQEEDRGALDHVSIPIVDLLGANPDRGFPVVKTDDHAVGKIGAEHLLERGFRNFGFCEYSGLFWSRARREGFEQRVQASGFSCQTYGSSPLGQGGPEMWEAHQLALMKWIESLAKPAGVMTTSDMLGQQLLEACQRMRVEIPDAVAVVGVDNDEPICRISYPPLTSVIIDDQQRGYEAAALLSRLMSGEAKPRAPILIEPIGVAARASSDVFAIEDDLLVRALRHLRDAAFSPVGVDQIASDLQVSRSLLERKFRRLLGRSVNDEIVRLRINRAIELLRETQLDLKVIASRCGYSSQAYMTTVFKQHLGRTPGSYRH
jgi:LacI family transcriptional regulator